MEADLCPERTRRRSENVTEGKVLHHHHPRHHLRKVALQRHRPHRHHTLREKHLKHSRRKSRNPRRNTGEERGQDPPGTHHTNVLSRCTCKHVLSHHFDPAPTKTLSGDLLEDMVKHINKNTVN